MENDKIDQGGSKKITLEMTPENLREVMYVHRLNAKKTAAMIHVSPASIYHWRTGHHKMPLGLWECLLLKLGHVPKMTIDGSDWSVG